MSCCFAQQIDGKNWLMLTQQILNLIQISDQFCNVVPPVRLMDLPLIYPEVHTFNRNELTNRNMVRLKNRWCDLSATIFIGTGFETSHLTFHLVWRFICAPLLEWSLYRPKVFAPWYINQTTFPTAYFSTIPFIWTTSLALQKNALILQSFQQKH